MSPTALARDASEPEVMGEVMHDYLNLHQWWTGTSNNYCDVDDRVRAHPFWALHPEGRVI